METFVIIVAVFVICVVVGMAGYMAYDFAITWEEMMRKTPNEVFLECYRQAKKDREEKYRS